MRDYQAIEDAASMNRGQDNAKLRRSIAYQRLMEELEKERLKDGRQEEEKEQ